MNHELTMILKMSVYKNLNLISSVVWSEVWSQVTA